MKKSKQTISPVQIKCGKCGNPEFIRTQNSESIVVLFRDGIGVWDNVIRDKDTECRFTCTTCGTLFEDVIKWERRVHL
jgi:hypothetical protein